MRPKTLDDDVVIKLAQSYFEDVCHGDASRIKLPELAKYIELKTGVAYPDYTLRRNVAIRDYVKSLKDAKKQDFSLSVISYKPIDAQQFVRDNPTPGKLIEAISKIDAYYKKVADYGADLYQAYQKIKAERNTLRKRVKELEEALELANDLLKEEKATHKTCAAELAAYKGVFEKYTYPDISNEILKKAGVIKGDTDSTVDTEAVKNELITKDCDILSFSNSKDDETTNTDTAPDIEALDVPEELVSESTVINMLSKRMFE